MSATHLGALVETLCAVIVSAVSYQFSRKIEESFHDGFENNESSTVGTGEPLPLRKQCLSGILVPRYLAEYICFSMPVDSHQGER